MNATSFKDAGTKNAFGWKTLFPNDKKIWTAFAKLAVFGALQFIFLWANTLADTLMVSNVYQSSQVVEGQVLSADYAKELNSLANGGLGGVGQWWYIISGVGIFTAVMVGFFVSQYYARGEMVNVQRLASLKVQLCVLVVVPFMIAMLIVPEQMTAFITRKADYDGVFLKNAIRSDGTAATVINDTYSNMLGGEYARLAAGAYLIWIIGFAIGSSQRDLGDPRGMAYSLGSGLAVHLAACAGMVYGAKLGIESAGYALLASRATYLLCVSGYGFLKKYPVNPYTLDLFLIHPQLLRQVLRRWHYPLLGLMWSTGVVGRFFFFYDYFPGDPKQSIGSALEITSAAGQIQNPFILQADFVLPIISLYVAQNLGRGQIALAKQYSRWCLGFALTVGLIITVLLGSVAFAIPSMSAALDYQPYILDQARWAVLIAAVSYPCLAVMFTISPSVSSGGRTALITAQGSGTTWLQVAWVVVLGEIQKETHAFDNFALAYACFYASEFLKLIPFYLVFSKHEWQRNMTDELMKNPQS